MQTVPLIFLVITIVCAAALHIALSEGKAWGGLLAATFIALVLFVASHAAALAGLLVL